MRVSVETYSEGLVRVERTVAGAADVESLLAEWAGREDTTLSFGRPAESEEIEVIVAITAAGYLLTRYRDGDFEQLVGAPQTGGDIVLTLGGQPTPTPRRWLLRGSDVRAALTSYVRDRRFPDGLTWEAT